MQTRGGPGLASLEEKVGTGPIRAGPLGPRACAGRPVFISPLPNFIYKKKIIEIAFTSHFLLH